MAHLRLLTANLFNGRAHPDALGHLLDTAKPDIAAFQELAPNVVDAIRRRLPFGDLDPREDYLGMGIVATRELLVEPWALPVRSGFRALLDGRHWDLPGEGLEILDAHLVNPLFPPPWRSVPQRRAQVEGILAHVAATPTVRRVLVGDMNASPAWPAYRALRASLADGAVAAGTAKRTWGPTWWFPRLLRIDHVFVSGVRVVATARHGVRASDHSALVIDLEV